MDEEISLALRARTEPEAFAPLYGRYVDPIYRYCYRRLGSREAAEDATSLVFAKALAALPSYRGGPFRSWLFAIAHNVITDGFRAARPTQPLAAATEIVDPAPTPEDLALVADGARWVQSLLAQLPAEQRRVVELRLSGLSGPEIGHVLGRSHVNVRSIQSRAIARLRALMGIRPASMEESRDADR